MQYLLFPPDFTWSKTPKAARGKQAFQIRWLANQARLLQVTWLNSIDRYLYHSIHARNCSIRTRNSKERKVKTIPKDGTGLMAVTKLLLRIENDEDHHRQKCMEEESIKRRDDFMIQSLTMTKKTSKPGNNLAQKECVDWPLKQVLKQTTLMVWRMTWTRRKGERPASVVARQCPMKRWTSLKIVMSL